MACVSGRVLRADGSPVANAEVWVSFPGLYLVMLQTDSSGNYLYNYYEDSSAPSQTNIIASTSTDGLFVAVWDTAVQNGSACNWTGVEKVRHLPSWQLSGTQYMTTVPDIIVASGTSSAVPCQPSFPADTDGDDLANDVEAFFGTSSQTSDTDGDGLTDRMEIYGSESPGFLGSPTSATDIRARGASPFHKDLFVQVDYHRKTGSGGTVSMYPSSTLTNQIAAFYGSLALPNPDGLLGINVVVLPGTAYDLDGVDCDDEFTDTLYYSLWRDNFFTHGLFCNGNTSTNNNGGRGKIGGSLFHVNVSPPNNSAADDATEPAVHLVYALFLHEVGHNLGLLHGGFENLNCKPNYPSNMNYGYDTEFNMNRSAVSISNTQLQYSLGELPELENWQLTETDPLNRTSAQLSFLQFFGGSSISTGFTVWPGTTGGDVDWNRNGVMDGFVPFTDPRATGSGSPSCANTNNLALLRDHDDIDRVLTKLPGRTGSGDSPGLPSADEDGDDPPADHRSEVETLWAQPFHPEELEEISRVVGVSGNHLLEWLKAQGIGSTSVSEAAKVAALVPRGGNAPAAMDYLRSRVKPRTWRSRVQVEAELVREVGDYLSKQMGRPIAFEFEDCGQLESIPELALDVVSEAAAIASTAKSEPRSVRREDNLVTTLEGRSRVSVCR